MSNLRKDLKIRLIDSIEQATGCLVSVPYENITLNDLYDLYAAIYQTQDTNDCLMYRLVSALGTE